MFNNSSASFFYTKVACLLLNLEQNLLIVAFIPILDMDLEIGI